MSDLVSSSDLVSELEKLIPTCSNLNIISAFVTGPAVSWLIDLVNDSSVCIVGRFAPKDFVEKASSIDALRNCMLAGFTVKCLPNLHAKIFQIDKETIFTGSANFTGKGLAIVNEGNLEACIQVRPSDLSKDFIHKIVDCSTELTEDVLQKMLVFLDNIESSESVNIPECWPEDIISRSNLIRIMKLIKYTLI